MDGMDRWYMGGTINNQMSQLEEQCEVSYWKEDAPVTREALMQGVKVISILVNPLFWL